MTYEIVTFILGGKVLKRTDEDGAEWFIPMDETNSDYQKYLEHLTENPTEDVE